jgi:hypothetical protein
MRHGRIAVVCNLGTSAAAVEVPGKWQVLLASQESIRLKQSSTGNMQVTLPPSSVTVLEALEE